MAESTLHLTEASFDTELGKHDELMMVDFWAEWCAPCRAIAPTLEELVREGNGNVTLAKVNVDEQPALAARYGIRSIPTILLARSPRPSSRRSWTPTAEGLHVDGGAWSAPALTDA